MNPSYSFRAATLAGALLAVVGAAMSADGALDDLSSSEQDAATGLAEITRDLAYGKDPQQRFDVYAPAGARNAPVIFMVHGGGWRHGDKRNRRVVDNKVAHWVARGLVFISTNYRLLPEADPLQQAQDVAHALAAAQADAPRWGGDADAFVLMGHSAGAHLAALLSADPQLAYAAGARPWLGSVLLDGAALDVEDTMQHQPLRLYRQAFGDVPTFWRQVSPMAHMSGEGPPILAVCSSTRRDDPCHVVERFVAQGNRRGRQISSLHKAMSHGEINYLLGEDSGYTAQVDTFLRSLSESLAQRLSPDPVTGLAPRGGRD